MIVLDSDHLSELQHVNSQRRARLVKRIEQQRDRTVATTIVSVEEQLRGRLATINKRPPGNEQVVPYHELIGLLEFCSGWIVLPFDHVSARQFHDLKAAKIRIGSMDLKIASIALAHSATLLSANLRDFRQVPNLSVEDWMLEEGTGHSTE
jgi:tRNA(fMet)-specific endonuclease VapC